MINLPNVTLVCADTQNYGEAIAAIRKSQNQIKPAKSIFFTDIKAFNPNFPFDIVKIDRLTSKADYSRFIVKELHRYIETDYVLIIQHDGYVLDGSAWDEDFLNYDYIGAPWLYIDGKNVGNGGFSLRSRKLMRILATDHVIEMTDPEDEITGRLYRRHLEEIHGIKFAPEEVADRFSYELREPVQPTFGFHGKFHKPFTPTVVVKRTGALGDCVAVEPILEYYHKKGYRVAIDMPIHIAMMYAQHHYPVYHISQLTDARIKPIVIDLDMAYENNPKQLHLKSYFEAAGISDYELKSPQLKFTIGDHNRLFKKYITLHIDNRSQPYRNVYGVNWSEIVAALNKKGYTVIQVGLTDSEDVHGAIKMQTCTINLLMMVIAGASYHIGVDSGPAAMAVALNVPAVIFFGSVKPEYIHPDLSNIKVIQNDCQYADCWHEVKGVDGQDCVFDQVHPPCTQFNTEDVLYKIDKFIS